MQRRRTCDPSNASFDNPFEDVRNHQLMMEKGGGITHSIAIPSHLALRSLRRLLANVDPDFATVEAASGHVSVD